MHESISHAETDSRHWTSRHTEQHGEPGIDVPESRTVKEPGRAGGAVMETRKSVLGPDHPDTLTSMNNLTWTLKPQGRSEEALKLTTACFQLLTEKLGANHPNTKACI